MNDLFVRVAGDAALFGGIGCCCVEAVQQGVLALRATKLSYFAQEPAVFGRILSANSLQLASVCAIFTVVDKVFQKGFEVLWGDRANGAAFLILRLMDSILITGAITTAVGITSSVAIATGLILATLIIYTIFLRIAEAYNTNRYSPRLARAAI